MHAALARFAVLLTALGLIACEKQKPADQTSSPDAAPPHITKSSRPPQDEALPALPHARDIPTTEESSEALVAIIENAEAADMASAQTAFSKLPAGSAERTRMIPHLAMRLAESDPAAATRWAESLEADQEQSLAFGKIALVLSANDPEAAAKMLSDAGVEGRDFDVAVVQVVQRWAAKSPADAAAWVTQFDPGEARTASLQAIATAWLDQDRPATFAWIQGMQNPTIRDEAITGAAESILTLPESKHAEALQGASPEIRERFEKLKAAAEGGDD